MQGTNDFLQADTTAATLGGLCGSTYERQERRREHSRRSVGDRETHSSTLEDTSRISSPRSDHNLGEGHSINSLDVDFQDLANSSSLDYVSSSQEDIALDARPARRRRQQMTTKIHARTTNIPIDLCHHPTPHDTEKNADSFDPSIATKTKRRLKLERELKAYNESPEPETQIENPFNLDDDVCAVRNTRYVAKCLKKLANNEELPLLPTQNVRVLMMEQYNPDRELKSSLSEGRIGNISLIRRKRGRRTKRTDYLDEEEEGEEEELDSDIIENSKYRKTAIKRTSSTPPDGKQGYTALPASELILDAGRRAATVGMNASGGQTTPRTKKQRTAFQTKVDMWSVDSVLEDADDEASPLSPYMNPHKRRRDRVLEDFDANRSPSGPAKRFRKKY